MGLPIHGFQTEGIPGSPAALWYYKTDPAVFNSPEFTINVGTVVRIETTNAHTPATIIFSQGNPQVLSGDAAISFIHDVIAFDASGGFLPVSTGDGLTWTLILQILSNSLNPFGDFGDRTPASRLYVGVPESRLNIIGQGYFKSYGVDVGEEGIRGGLFTSIGGVTLAAINDGEPGHHMGVAVYALGIRHNTSDDGVAALGGDSYNDSGGNAIGVHGYVSSVGVPASSLYGFYAFHNDGAALGISAGYYAATQAGTSSSLNAAFYAEDQGTGAHDYGIYIAGGKSYFGGPLELGEGTEIIGAVGIGINASAQTALSALYIGPVAGSGGASWTSVFLNNPDGIAFDAAGNLYFCGMGHPLFKADPIVETLTLFAGGSGNHGAPNWFGVGGLSLASWLWQCGNLAVDKITGVVYMVQQDGQFLEAFDPITGIMTNVAGTPSVSGGTYSGDGGPAINAGFNNISAIALDSNGNIVVGNSASGGGKVRVVNMETTSASFWGVTIASGDIDAVATHDYVTGLAIDGVGNLFIGGGGDAPSIAKITPVGVSTTFAGGHTFSGSYSGDGGLATAATLGAITGISVDASDNIYFFSQYAIHKIDKNTGIITTIAGTSNSPAFSGDGGLATSAQMLGTTNGFYTQTAFDAAGDLYVTDGSTTSDACIRKIDMNTGIITSVIRFVAGLVPVPISGLAVDAQIQYPLGMETDSAGNVYFCNDGFNAVCKIANGVYSVIAGTGTYNYSGDGGPATSAELGDPEGVTILPNGSVMYIADSTNDVVRKVDMNTGIITTFAGIFNSYSYSGRGGPATSADLNYPENVTVDAVGNLYIADSGNNVISRVDKNTGIITDIAGDFGTYGTGGGYAGDGGPATAAAFLFPCGLRFDEAGNLYIADYYNAAIRKIDTGGTITTFAGTGVAGYSGDGGPATSAQLSFPFDVATDAEGNVYITDTGNSVVRKVDTNGIITTTAGPGLGIYFGDGGPAINAGINTLWNLCIHAGTVYISEGGTFGFIRKIASSPATAVQFWCGTDPTGLDALFGLPSGLRTRAFVGKNDEAPGLFVGTQNIGTAVALDCQSVVTGFFGSGWGLKVTASSSATAPFNDINGLTGVQVNVDHHSSGNCAAITGLLVNAATVVGTVGTVAGIKIATQSVGLHNYGLLIEDQGSGYAIHSAGGRMNISGLPSYAGNATALAAGLGKGDLYRLGDTIGVVH